MAADATIWLLVSLPGVILALAIGALHFDFGLTVNPLIVPALFLISLTGISIGYCIAHGAPKPQTAHLATQIIVFAIMLFSPVMYPIEQLPEWLATVHKFLPIKYMADLSRGTLTDIEVNLGLAFSVVGIWALASVILTYVLVRRRV